MWVKFELFLGFKRMARRRFHCTNCGKSYTMRNNLRRHQRVECGKEKSIECYFCNRKFYYKQELTLHIRMRHDRI